MLCSYIFTGFAVIFASISISGSASYLSYCATFLHLLVCLFSVQFHPEAMGGPEDLELMFDVFIQQVNAQKSGGDNLSVKSRLTNTLR